MLRERSSCVLATLRPEESWGHEYDREGDEPGAAVDQAIARKEDPAHRKYGDPTDAPSRPHEAALPTVRSR